MNIEELQALCSRAAHENPGLGEPVLEFGELSVDAPRNSAAQIAKWFRDNGPFEMLADTSAIDWLGHEPDERRFLVSVQLASISHPGRIRLRLWLPADDPVCESLVLVWPGAEALEREMWDLFGISFEGNQNLTRILMPDEWQGHPQRKDEPLGGINVLYEHGQSVLPPDDRQSRPTSTSGYPGRTS